MADAHIVLGESRPVQVTFPRALGALAAVWGLRLGWSAARSPDAEVLVWVSLALLWMVAAAALASDRRTGLAGLLVAVLAALEFLATGSLTPYGLALLFWMGVIVAVTDGHPDDRALLLKVCATVVYASTGLAKANPSWLAGDNLVLLASTRPQMAPFHDLVSGWAGPPLATAVVALELWLAVGLWFRRTRVPTAVLGVAMHLSLMASAISTVSGLTNLTVLNLGLVSLYLAFWHEPDRPDVPTTVDSPASLPTGG